MNRIGDFGVTNCVIDTSNIIEPENMTASMRLVILNNGDTIFVNSGEEYHKLILEGLVDVK